MSWNRPAAVAALVDVLAPIVATGVSVLPAPAGSYNPPAILIQYPTTVTYHTPAFAIDTADWTVTGIVGIDQGDTLDLILNAARDLIEADQTLGGVVQVCQPTEKRAYRLQNVAGADYLVADLVLNTRM